jgi:hypothetical protein
MGPLPGKNADSFPTLPKEGEMERDRAVVTRSSR